MNPMIVGIIGMAVMLLLLFMRMPIAFAMGLVGFVGVWYFRSLPGALNIGGNVPFSLAYNYDFSVLPLFLLMANICLYTGVSRDLFAMVYKWMGRLPGGLAVAAIGAATIFGAVSASAIATCVTIGSVAVPEMRKYKYQDSLSTACVAVGGVLGTLIPPSSVLIIYGIMTENSIGKLFMAGLIPGIILCIMFMVMIIGRCIYNPKLGPPGQSTSFKEKIVSIGACGEILALIVLCIGGLLIGWFTPTEAGGIGAFGAVVVTLIRNRLKWKGFKNALWDTANSAGLVYFLLIGAFLLNNFLTMSNIPMEAAQIVAGLHLSPAIVMSLIIIIYLIMGCFIESLSLILLTIPIFYPVAIATGWNPLWFGVLLVLVGGFGMITPPVGIGVYVIAGLFKDISMGTIFKGIWPFLFTEVIFAGLLVAFPQICTYLPSLMK